MTIGEGANPKKSKARKWKILGFSILILIVLGALFGEDTSTPTPAPKESEEPVASFTYSAEITRWEPINPASGRATFTIFNTGELAFVPDTCTVRVQDGSGNYKGYDFIIGFTETIKPGGKFMGNVVLTVTKEGAFFVTNGSVDCELKSVP